MNLLTKEQAAAVLQKSISTIDRLRRAGHLAYLPGRPVLIDAADLYAYIEGAKQCRDQTQAPDSPSTSSAGSTKSATRSADEAAAIRRVRAITRKRNGSSPTF